MGELIGRLVADAGVDRTAAEKADKMDGKAAGEFAAAMRSLAQFG
jgi:hypothetical protein